MYNVEHFFHVFIATGIYFSLISLLISFIDFSVVGDRSLVVESKDAEPVDREG